MGLFDAKYCSICGDKLGLLGTTKLEDGHLCKECTRKLSPYFPRRHQTVETVKQHLAYRQENAARLADLNLTATYGDAQKIMIDEEKKLFVISRSTDVHRTNPDIFRFADVISIAKEVEEDAEELAIVTDLREQIQSLTNKISELAEANAKLKKTNRKLSAKYQSELDKKEKFKESLKGISVELLPDEGEKKPKEEKLKVTDKAYYHGDGIGEL